jgi:predicted RNA-binding Zn-ribbon protein involved in translation (DUF1610 family)
MFKEYYKAALRHLIDNLNRFLLVIFLILFIISLFIKNFFLDLTKVLLLVIIILRIFDKNTNRREKQNKIYLKYRNFLIKPFDVLIKNIKDKEHVYKRCHKCKTILKLPLPDKRGIKHSKCPNCGKRITFITFKQIKIEVIKRKK